MECLNDDWAAFAVTGNIEYPVFYQLPHRVLERAKIKKKYIYILGKMNVTKKCTKLLRVAAIEWNNGLLVSRSVWTVWPTRNLIATRTKEHFQLRMARAFRHLMAVISYLLLLIEVYVLHSCNSPYFHRNPFQIKFWKQVGVARTRLWSTHYQPGSHVPTVSLIQMNCLC